MSIRGFQLTPARGRKRHQPSFARAHEISTHPREGTKTTEANIYLWTMPDFNSPPRGDENVVLTSRCLVDAISTHPREGTKTAEMIGELSGPNFNSPPRGDENPLILLCTLVAHISTHPREGTKTFLRYTGNASLRISTHPREGTKTSIQYADSVV